ncbi:hypothetical protein [Chelativorans sp. YIM 93263]|uniref:hypothetical protein n=1 Tax=Chelativorans sp. YIM 93263 TaxID=2906648 RepID=UPI0023790D4C|nr:hypothetical protein [Chelativorans sp. YIM 93263]
MARIQAFAAALAIALSTVPMHSEQAQAADFIAKKVVPQDGICAHKSVRGAIRSRFRHQVTHVPHLPNVDIVDFYGARLTRYEPATPNSPIERRYCAATALLSSGDNRPIWYLIEYGQGFAGIGDNVEFCVSGFDRWNVYDAACRVLR